MKQIVSVTCMAASHQMLQYRIDYLLGCGRFGWQSAVWSICGIRAPLCLSVVQSSTEINPAELLRNVVIQNKEYVKNFGSWTVFCCIIDRRQWRFFLSSSEVRREVPDPKVQSLEEMNGWKGFTHPHRTPCCLPFSERGSIGRGVEMVSRWNG